MYPLAGLRLRKRSGRLELRRTKQGRRECGCWGYAGGSSTISLTADTSKTDQFRQETALRGSHRGARGMSGCGQRWSAPHSIRKKPQYPGEKLEPVKASKTIRFMIRSS